MDAIAHVVRCFEDKNVAHRSSGFNPIDDIEIIETELKLADIETLRNRADNLRKLVKNGNKEIKIQLDIIDILFEQLNGDKTLGSHNWSADQLKIFKKLNLITNKPMFYVSNVDEKSIINGNHLSNLVEEKCKKTRNKFVLVSAAIECQIAQLNDNIDKIELLKQLKLKETTLKKVINSGYKMLNLVTFFTSGPKETRAWTVTKNTTASMAAGKIHSDFEKGFIRAETTSFNDFINFNGEVGCRDKGKLRQEGKSYIVQDGDIINFLFNV